MSAATRNGRRVDVSLAENPDFPGTPLAHRPDCDYVRAQAMSGEPVITMLDCAGMLPDALPRHDCLLDASGELIV